VAASIRDTFATLEHGDVSTLVKRVVVFVLAIEAVGALLLLVRFSSQFELPRALWLAVFHAVSAFCNAGFSLFPDGLIGYAEDPLVVLTVGTLIVLGGIGFVIQAELWERLRGRRRSRHLSLHARTALFTSGVLIALGAVGFYALEREGALRGASWLGHLLIPLFSAVTPRTAGFNTIDFGALREVTLLGVIVLMFIGASPGSTGGGIKTTTLAVLARFLTARLTSRQPQHLFDRSVPMSSVLNAFQILGAALGLVVLATGALALTEEGLARFLDYAFEATSAFGTVGLSTGITPKLSTTGKLVLVAVMFLGRTGPLLLVIVAARSAEEVPAYRYPEEEVMIG
jgi:trk system potassium uptake protein TrkH